MNPHKSRRETYLAALTQYQTRTGTTRVPTAHIEELAESGAVNLGGWVSYVKQRYRAGLITPDSELVQQLNQIDGWFWEAQKPGPTTDVVRNREILSLRDAGVSLQKIGDTFGLSRQRVHQIVQGAK
jgi:hypothetical protein